MVPYNFKMFERETRREKILEARNKELRLKEKTKGILNLGGGGGLMNIGGGGGGTEGGEGGASPGKTAVQKAAMTAIALPTTGAQDKKDEKRIKGMVKTEPSAEGEGGEDGKKPKKEEEEDTEDPIVKAEREFFEIIKQVNEMYNE